MLKKIGFPLISIFLTYRTIELLKVFHHSSPHDFIFIGTLMLAVLVNLFITGVFAFMGFAYPTSRILPDSYYRIKKPKTLTLIYNLLGVKYFKSMLLITFWGQEKNRKKYFNGTKSGIKNFDFETRQSEFGHLGAFIIISLASLLPLSKGFVLFFVITSIINFISNIYPVILQRIHRLQIERITSLRSA